MQIFGSERCNKPHGGGGSWKNNNLVDTLPLLSPLHLGFVMLAMH